MPVSFSSAQADPALALSMSAVVIYACVQPFFSCQPGQKQQKDIRELGLAVTRKYRGSIGLQEVLVLIIG